MSVDSSTWRSDSLPTPSWSQTRWALSHTLPNSLNHVNDLLSNGGITYLQASLRQAQLSDTLQGLCKVGRSLPLANPGGRKYRPGPSPHPYLTAASRREASRFALCEHTLEAWVWGVQHWGVSSSSSSPPPDTWWRRALGEGLLQEAQGVASPFPVPLSVQKATGVGALVAALTSSTSPSARTNAATLKAASSVASSAASALSRVLMRSDLRCVLALQLGAWEGLTSALELHACSAASFGGDSGKGGLDGIDSQPSNPCPCKSIAAAFQTLSQCTPAGLKKMSPFLGYTAGAVPTPPIINCQRERLWGLGSPVKVHEVVAPTKSEEKGEVGADVEQLNAVPALSLLQPLSPPPQLASPQPLEEPPKQHLPMPQSPPPALSTSHVAHLAPTPSTPLLPLSLPSPLPPPLLTPTPTLPSPSPALPSPLTFPLPPPTPPVSAVELEAPTPPEAPIAVFTSPPPLPLPPFSPLPTSLPSPHLPPPILPPPPFSSPPTSLSSPHPPPPTLPLEATTPVLMVGGGGSSWASLAEGVKERADEMIRKLMAPTVSESGVKKALEVAVSLSSTPLVSPDETHLAALVKAIRDTLPKVPPVTPTLHTLALVLCQLLHARLLSARGTLSIEYYMESFECATGILVGVSPDFLGEDDAPPPSMTSHVPPILAMVATSSVFYRVQTRTPVGSSLSSTPYTARHMPLKDKLRQLPKYWLHAELVSEALTLFDSSMRRKEVEGSSGEDGREGREGLEAFLPLPPSSTPLPTPPLTDRPQRPLIYSLLPLLLSLVILLLSLMLLIPNPWGRMLASPFSHSPYSLSTGVEQLWEDFTQGRGVDGSKLRDLEVSGASLSKSRLLGMGERDSLENALAQLRALKLAVAESSS